MLVIIIFFPHFYFHLESTLSSSIKNCRGKKNGKYVLVLSKNKSHLYDRHEQKMMIYIYHIIMF